MFRRFCVVAGASALATGLVVGALGAPASAQSFPGVICVAKLVGDITLTLNVPRDLSATVNGPTEANAGTDFTVTIKGGSTDLPTTNSGLTIASYQDLGTKYKVTGGSIVAGSASSSGQPTINGTPTTGQATIQGTDGFFSGTPGPIPPGTLVTPDVSFKIHAGAAGSTVTVSVIESKTVANLPSVNATATVTCPYPDNTLATTQVVTPPPPGAPDAVADVAKTDEGEAVTIDVLANDVANQNGPIDEDSLEITAPPTKGTAAINGDHTITYTPGSGSGVDEFTYRICSEEQVESEQVAQVEAAPCDTAIVTVNVLADAPPVTTGSTVAPQATTPTTVAATAELPRTGRSSLPLGLVGFAAVALGCVAMRLARARRAF